MNVNRGEIFFLVPMAGSSNVAAIAKRLRTTLKASVLTRHPQSIVPGQSAVSSNGLYFFLLDKRGFSYSAGVQIRACIAALTAVKARFILLCDLPTMNTLGPFPTDAWAGRIHPDDIERELDAALPWLRNGRLWCSSTDLQIVLGSFEGCVDEVMEHAGTVPSNHLDMELLTVRQREVAELVSQGVRNEVIGRSLCISVATVKTHVSRILATLGLESRTELAAHFRRVDRKQVKS